MLKLAKYVALSLIIAAFSLNANAQMFGRDEVKYDDIRDFKKWKDVMKKNEMDMLVNDQVTRKWKEAIAEIGAMNLSREEKIAAVNEFINKSIQYSNDSTVWGMSDYWASPTEAFNKGYGDCEDYALAKFYSLQMLGLQEDEMRIVVLNDTRKNELHAILVVDASNGKNYVLDNQNQTLMMDTQIAYYSPIYSINTHSWWKHS